MPTAPCPTREQLSNYVAEKLLEEESSVISLHVDECRTCVDTIDMFADNTDSPIAALQQPMPANEYADEAGCRQVVATAEKLGRDPELAARWREASLPLDWIILRSTAWFTATSSHRI